MKLNVSTPPSSFALGWELPPVCCTINTFPKSAANPGVPNPAELTGSEVLNKRAFPFGIKPPVPGASSEAVIDMPISLH